MKDIIAKILIKTAKKLLDIQRTYIKSNIHSTYFLHVCELGSDSKTAHIEGTSITYGSADALAHAMSSHAQQEEKIAEMIFHALKIFAQQGGEAPDGVQVEVGKIPSGFEVVKKQKKPQKIIN